MSKNASNFIRNRRTKIAVTGSRIMHILWYMAECYQKVVSDSPGYRTLYASVPTNIAFEDFLKIEFVENYLIPNKDLLQSRTPDLIDVNFHFETQKSYVDSKDGLRKVDKIDVYINRLGLNEVWGKPDEHVYFAAECKRIEILSDCKEYVIDTQKFADRDYDTLRLPYEAQIAFIENKKLSISAIVSEIDSRLKAISKSLTTSKYLEHISFHSTFAGGYLSEHSRNYSKGSQFAVFHLLFDYSHLVV